MMSSESVAKIQKIHQNELTVEIRRGSNLADKKMIGSHSVYIAIDVDGETKRTKTVDDINNPVWNETFTFLLDKIPEQIELRVRDDRTILPNLNLGHYILPLKERLINYNAYEPCIVENGEVSLRDVLTGKLDIRIVLTNANMINNNNVISSSYSSTTLPLQSKFQGGSYEEIKKADFETLPKALNKTIDVVDDKRDEYIINDSNEVHVLPTLYVQEQPIIIEKEVEYIKPVEVHQTIVHRIKPTIVEQPTIVEKHEHYRAPTEIIRQEEKIILERVDEADVGNLDQKTIEDLRVRRKAEFNDKTPIIQFEKEQIRLDTNIEQRPTEIREKEVVYEQPIEIERKEIEHVREKVVETVKLQKEHVHQKVEPEIIKEDVEVINTGDRFYSQEATATTPLSLNNDGTRSEKREKEMI